jgi:hypothetical protein
MDNPKNAKKKKEKKFADWREELDQEEDRETEDEKEDEDETKAELLNRYQIENTSFSCVRKRE